MHISKKNTTFAAQKCQILFRERNVLLPYVNRTLDECDVLLTYADRIPRECDVLLTYVDRTSRECDVLLSYADRTSRECDVLLTYADRTSRECNVLLPYAHRTFRERDMLLQNANSPNNIFNEFNTSNIFVMSNLFRTFTFDDCYVSIREHAVIDEANDVIVAKLLEEIVVPEVDSSILHAVLTIYMTHHYVKAPREVARLLRLNVREVSGTVHILTGMSHEDLLRRYRLCAIRELLLGTTLSVQTIATHFGYSSIHALNRFLSDQTGMSANMIRRQQSSTCQN